MTDSYQGAIKKAIEEYNGILSEQLASEISAINSRINKEVSALSDRISSLEARVETLEEQMNELNKQLSIKFDAEGSIAYSPGEQVTIGFTLKNAADDATVETLGENGWSSVVEMKTQSTGVISVSTPIAGGAGKILVFVNSGNKTIVRSLIFDEGQLKLTNTAYVVEPGDTTISVNIETNLDKYEICIPKECESWISVVTPGTRANIRTDIANLKIELNPSNESRFAVIAVKDVVGTVLSSFSIYQYSDVQPNNEIWYTSTDGKIVQPNREDQFFVDIVSNTYVNGKGVIRFQDDLFAIGTQTFDNCRTLKSIFLPKGVTYLGQFAFEKCSKLETVCLPDGITKVSSVVS